MADNPKRNPDPSLPLPVGKGALAAQPLTVAKRRWVITAALMALFLGAMDALIMTAAMPTIVAELGGLHIFSWVYSAYFLARAVALPIFGKLADLFKNKALFLFAIGLFVVASLLAGFAPNMTVLIIARALQGIGAGGNFALVYIVLTDIAVPGKRGRTLSLGSFIWGLASVMGPTLGGVMVTYLSWRWIFFINLPLGMMCMLVIAICLVELRPKDHTPRLDWAGAATFSVAIVAFLSIFMMAQRSPTWTSPPMLVLMAITLVAGIGFVWAERRAADPLLPIAFLKLSGFGIGNLSVFLSSFTIFILFAYSPLYIQGALGRTAVDVGMAMLSLSLGWSLGSLILGQLVHALGHRKAALIGGGCLAGGCWMTLLFTPRTTILECFVVFLVVGLGMGFVTLSTLLVVQESVDTANLGIATAVHQFARTMGGTVGIGVCGSFMTARLEAALAAMAQRATQEAMPAYLMAQLEQHWETLFQPEVQALIPPVTRELLQTAVANGVSAVFWVAALAAVACCCACWRLPRPQQH